MTRTIFVPVGYAEAADRVANLAERGVICIQTHWLSREACQSYIDSLPSFLKGQYWPTAAVVRVAEGAPRFLTGPQTGVRSLDCEARSLGFPLAGGAGLNGTVLAPTASMTDRRDGGCVSGNPITEGADGWNGPLPAIGSSFGDRSFGDQEGRHVA